MQSIKLTHEQIKKLTFDISSLSQVQRELIRHVLMQLHDQTGGTIWHDKLHKELIRMKNEGEISDIDLRGVEDAVWG